MLKKIIGLIIVVVVFLVSYITTLNKINKSNINSKYIFIVEEISYYSKKDDIKINKTKNNSVKNSEIKSKLISQPKKVVETPKKTDLNIDSSVVPLVNNNYQLYQELIFYINQYREELNISKLTYDYNLSLAATSRALEIGNTGKVSHTRPNNTKCFTILDDLGIKVRYAGENIVTGTKNPESAAIMWRKSTKGHYETMINKNYHKVGIGYTHISNGNYWVAIFSD